MASHDSKNSVIIRSVKMSSTSLLAVYLILFGSRFSNVICDGNHGAASSATVQTTSSDGEGTVSSLLSGISPDILSSLAGNPQIAQALAQSGVDVGASAAANAAADAGGAAVPPPVAGPAGVPGGLPSYAGGLLGGLPGGYAAGLPGGLPGGLGGGFPGGFPGGLGGLGGLPFFGGQKSLHVSGDFGLYYPYIEKIIIVVGGGILLLVILALLTKGLAKGGLLSKLGTSVSEALAGSASIDIGPVHKSVAGAAAVSAGGGRIGDSPQDIQLTQRVYDGLDQRF